MIKLIHYDLSDGTVDVIHEFDDDDRVAAELMCFYECDQDHGTDSVYYLSEM